MFTLDKKELEVGNVHVTFATAGILLRSALSLAFLLDALWRDLSDPEEVAAPRGE